MRSSIKIKAFTVFFAWLVIFAHSIVPHNHMQENDNGCHDLIHRVTQTSTKSDLTPEFDSQPDKVTTCHFTNLLFNKFSQDNFIASTNRDSCFYPVISSGLTVNHTTYIYLTEPYHGTSSLRAPPLT